VGEWIGLHVHYGFGVVVKSGEVCMTGNTDRLGLSK